MSKRILILLLIATTIAARAQHPSGASTPLRPAAGAATIREYNQNFPTYPFSDPSPLPLLNAVYPYFRYDSFTDKPISKPWKVVELENDYIRLLILPEIGGKIWTAIERSTNRPFIYFNHSVKFRDVAMRGPWTSGGLEANYGIIGHTPNCATPVDYTTRANPDGSVSCIIGALDLLTRSYWRMEIRLPRDQALFSTRSYWYNNTPLEQPYYHWMNAGLKADGDLEFIYPGNRYVGHDGEYAPWPINKANGKNIAWYKNNDFGGYKSYHVFGKYTDFSGAYWHDDDYGMVRYGAHDDKPGKKLWIWGLSRQGMIWEKLLTDTDGQYIELQSGRLFNQNTPRSTLTPFKHRPFMPYGADTWEEKWYPVLGTKGFLTANADGALNIQYQNGWLKLFFSPTHEFTDTLQLTIDDKPIYSRTLSFQPLRLFTDSLRADSGHLTASLINSRLCYDSDPAATTLARPVDAPANFDWNSAYGNYLKGQESSDQKDYATAETALLTALQKDPNYAPALTALATLLYRNMRYADALQYATRALSINTEDGPANFIYGLANEALGRTTDARDGFDIATLDPACRSAAYTCLARLSLKQNDPARAQRYAEKALVTNTLNMEALQLRAVCARLNNPNGVDTRPNNPKGVYTLPNNLQAARPEHQRLLALIDSLDPLNHFSRFEKYLADPSLGNKQNFLTLIRNELPQETFLELGIWYYNCGLINEALLVFHLAPPIAEINLWIARLSGKPIDWSTIDPTRAFPFRSETGALLEAQLNTDNHWFLKYQLAFIYRDRNRLDEAKRLLRSCGDTPDYAPFYAFRAQLLAEDSQYLHDLQKARTLDPGWRYQKMLTEYYLRTGNPPQALSIIEPFYRSHPDLNAMGLLYARALLSNHRYQQADRLLAQLQVLPAEGATSAHDLYREAKLMEAVEKIKRKDYKKALSFIAAAKLWPENLGSGAPYPADQDLRLENYLSSRCSAAAQNSPAPPPNANSPIETRVLDALK